MAKYPFIVDGQDFTDLFHKYGYEVTYEFREGENGFLMCSGDELRDLLAGRVFVAHNVSFDSRFLLAEYSRMGASIPVDQSTMLCTMKLSRSLIGRGKLADCCEYFGIANEDAHSALSDAHATAILLGRLLEADPKWPGFQRRLDAAGAAAEQWPTFATLPKKEWLPRGTHLA